MIRSDVLVIGGGPAGLAAAISATKENSKVILLERESRLGGILKQCIHDGFGLVRFKEKLSGPEYVEKFIDEFNSLHIEHYVLTYVTRITKVDNGYDVTIVNTDGVNTINTKTIILATGCRERTAKQIKIHGSRPAGVFTAGSAQHYVNLLGQKVCNKCVILGSGDIGLIMARRLTLEGSKVLGVYEVMPNPSGLTRNIHQCLIDYNIPLYLSHTVTRIIGKDRVEAVEISKVDEKLQVIKGSEEIVECDALILSVGLIPENEIAESIGVSLDNKTKGPLVDAQFMTNMEGVFSCGNALHVNDLVDYVSESGEEAGRNAAHYVNKDNKYVDININQNVSYLVPQRINLNNDNTKVIMYFRSKKILNNHEVIITIDGKEKFKKLYPFLRPPEMERIEIDLNDINDNSIINFEIREKQ